MRISQTDDGSTAGCKTSVTILSMTAQNGIFQEELGNYAGIPPTGKQVSVMGISILRLAQGRIVERWNVSEELGLLQQLGIIPSTG
ncbi:MAG: ester cyclase [Dehalococcoidia bacterium]|nr:ester cyclase [Dehalococcoidia bacterium]